MDATTLTEICRKHALWLQGKKDGVRADLRRADLSGANLRGADLCEANLCGADLREADLSGKDLREANLYGADLRGADLREANLCGADLRGANLREADLCGVDLRRADLRGADLCGVDLRRADLREADLYATDLRWANLRGADLRGANLYEADLRAIRDDVRAVLDLAPAEVPGLLLALREGRIDGSVYNGECACLIGTLANVRGVPVDRLGELTPYASRPAERWFLAIYKGDTPATNPVAAIAEEWIVEWVGKE